MASAKKTPIVSVIVPFRSFNDRVKDCIDSLMHQNYRKTEIITVSDKERINIPGIKSIYNPRFHGVGRKRNAGSKASIGDILFFLDSDCRVKKDTIQKVVKMFGQIDADGITCKPLAPKDASIVDFVMLVEQEDRYNRIGEAYVNVAATTCFAVKRSVFFLTGGFVDYIVGEATGEDWDFALRMRRFGYRIFHTNKIGVIHNHVSGSLMAYLKGQYFRARYRVAYKKRYVRYTDEYATTNMFVTSTVLLGMPTILRMGRKVRELKLLALIPIALLRNLVWLIGFADEALFHKS